MLRFDKTSPSRRLGLSFVDSLSNKKNGLFREENLGKISEETGLWTPQPPRKRETGTCTRPLWARGRHATARPHRNEDCAPPLIKRISLKKVLSPQDIFDSESSANQTQTEFQPIRISNLPTLAGRKYWILFYWGKPSISGNFISRSPMEFISTWTIGEPWKLRNMPHIFSYEEFST